MRQDKATLAGAAIATVLGVLSVPLVASTEARAQAVDQPLPAYNRIRRCLAPYRLPFCRPMWSRSCYGFGTKLQPSSIVIWQSGTH